LLGTPAICGEEEGIGRRGRMHAVKELHPGDSKSHSQARRVWPWQSHDAGESGERADDVTEHDGARRASGSARHAEEEDGHGAEGWALALEVARLPREDT